MSILPDVDDAVDEARPAVSQDVRDTIELLLWAREKGFRLPEVHIGTVHIQVTDLRQPRREGIAPVARGSIYDEHREEGDEPIR
jgi:hypothetical protein